MPHVHVLILHTPDMCLNALFFNPEPAPADPPRGHSTLSAQPREQWRTGPTRPGPLHSIGID
jgi:hypothetical protein